ncbi:MULTISPECIES: efflux RND transporter periplasmic adaptor subunit [unclassified Aureimonas]|uniref:efflux RND transporter periplasmic adaptor subunit n=1 Tax=unclassified Aureimonas TaxID=2615206 RepID=UPI0006FE79C5|nr:MULTISPECIES: efflux RND transporter periplasmic adaptor subunit [unclassified Aureimonas]KQT52783.1 hypothetical protein ASG62_12690 [Aureimonas sp. Leaf427]KQT80242.1 hypothetical protein ASG54_06540 [Aureimonas sp. Leaf460]
MSKPLLCLLTLATFASAASATRAQDAASAAVPPTQERVSLTVTTDAVRRESVAAKVSGTGLVEAWQEVAVGAPTGGLALVEILAEEGDRVEAGAVVARLDASLIEAELAQSQAQQRSAEASFSAAVSANERGQRLGKSGSLAAETIEERQTAVETTRAAVEQAKAAVRTLEVQLDRTVIRAPFAGRVSSKPATLGTIVQAGAEILRLQREGRLEAAIRLPEQYLAHIAVGDAADVTGPDGAVLQARIASIAETVDSASHLGTVRIGLPGDTKLKAGMFVRAGVSAGGEQTMTVASGALTFREGRPAVFVVGANNQVFLKPVEVGTRGGDRVAVSGALSEGERVVTSGAGFLNDGAVVRVVSQAAETGAPVEIVR